MLAKAPKLSFPVLPNHSLGSNPLICMLDRSQIRERGLKSPFIFGFTCFLYHWKAKNFLEFFNNCLLLLTK